MRPEGRIVEAFASLLDSSIHFYSVADTTAIGAVKLHGILEGCKTSMASDSVDTPAHSFGRFESI